VSRSKEQEYLEKLLEHPLTLLCAPAGFGKTTLLAQWAHRCGSQVAWIALEESDNDPSRFWTAVLTALERLVSGAARYSTQAASFSSMQRHLALTAVCNALASAQQPVILMLDDYAVLRQDAAAIHEGMAFLTEHLPAQVHLVLTGRREPPLPLARLRAHGQLYELRTLDLRLSSEESAAFLSKSLNGSMGDQDAAALHARTEGWAAGLCLAVEALKGEANLSSAVARFGGEHPFIVDFLDDEVLQMLPTALQRFLLETSVLSQLNAALCEALTGVSNSQGVLDLLAQAGLFLFAVDEQRLHYRFHPLFAEALRLRLQQSQPERVPALRLRASEWHAAQGDWEAAISYAFAAGDLARAAWLMEQVAEEWLRSGTPVKLPGWLHDLPDALIARWPRLSVAQAYLLLTSGQHAAFEQRLQALAPALPDDDGGQHQTEQGLLGGEMLALRAARASLRGQVLQAVTWGKRAAAALPEGHRLRQLALLTLGNTFRLIGETQSAGQVLEEARRESEPGRDALLFCISSAHLALVRVLEGRLQAALELCKEAETWARCQGLPLEGQATALIEGLVHYERNELEAAAACLGHCLRLRSPFYPLLLLACGYPTLAFVRQGLGDRAGALRLLEQARVELEEQWPWAGSSVHAQQVRLWLMQGNLLEASKWRHAYKRSQQARQSSLEQGFAEIWEQEQLALAHSALALGHPQEALKVLAGLHQQARAAGRRGRVLLCLVLEAAAYESLRLLAQALRALEQALVLGEPEGYVRPFLLGGAPVQRGLLRLQQLQKERPQAAPFRFSASYLETLLAAFRDEQPLRRPESRCSHTVPASLPGPLKTPAPTVGLLEPLSEREQEILRIVRQGASNREIAHRLAIALSTVKRHLSNIYGKLGVRSRTQALAMAQPLDLL
jgi:LuxR family maltose regulon positive regulatory protein